MIWYAFFRLTAPAAVPAVATVGAKSLQKLNYIHIVASQSEEWSIYFAMHKLLQNNWKGTAKILLFIQESEELSNCICTIGTLMTSLV